MKELFKIHIIKNFIIAFTLAFNLASPLAFTLTSTLVIISTSNANANIFNKFKKGFYFEKYSTAEEAKAALLELHPIGSDVGELVKTLERAGAKVKKYKTSKAEILSYPDSKVEYYFFKYFQKTFPIFGYNWGGSIDFNKKIKIEKFYISKYSETF
jgi:hypothetical protein